MVTLQSMRGWGAVTIGPVAQVRLRGGRHAVAEVIAVLAAARPVAHP